MSEVDEILEIVNKSNRIIGQRTRGEIYKNGFLHRAVSVFIVNSKGQIFLQQRSKLKMKYPLAWDVSAAEHVKVGESYEDAALRGIQEELGIDTKLKKVRGVHLQHNGHASKKDKIIDDEFVVTFIGVYDGRINLDSEEVNDGKFFQIDKINKMIDSGKTEFTTWFLDDWRYLIENL